MRKFSVDFINTAILTGDRNKNDIVKISWGGYGYKRINNKEERIGNKYKKTNLYVDSA